jgi:hypothetical protein
MNTTGMKIIEGERRNNQWEASGLNESMLHHQTSA